VPVANSTPSSPACERVTRAVRSRGGRRWLPRPDRAAATWAAGTRSDGSPGAASRRGSGRRTARPRSSSGNTPCLSASAHHSAISSASLLGVGGGEVVALRPSPRRGGTAPTLGGEVGPGHVRQHRLPLAGDQRPLPRSRSTAPCWSRGRGSRSTAANGVPGDGHLLEARRPRAAHADQVVDGGHDVGDEHELARAWCRAARPAMPVRPVEHHRHVHAAFVGVLLVPAERRVAALRPAPRVVGVAVRAADGRRSARRPRRASRGCR
jgi:hypothetical protein